MLALSWSIKTYIFCLKIIAVCPACNQPVFLMLHNVFIHALDRYAQIQASFDWCFLAFVMANLWVIRIYAKTNFFGVTLLKHRMFAPGIFIRSYYISVTSTLSRYKFSYHSIRFQSQCTQKHTHKVFPSLNRREYSLEYDQHN